MPVCLLPANKLNAGLPIGQHLHCGIRRHVSRNSPWPPVCVPVHCFWDNPKRHAHLHPLQQVFGLLRQAEGAREREQPLPEALPAAPSEGARPAEAVRVLPPRSPLPALSPGTGHAGC